MRLNDKTLYAVLIEGNKMEYLGTGADVKQAKMANALPEGEVFIIERAGAKIEAQTIFAIVPVNQ